MKVGYASPSHNLTTEEKYKISNKRTLAMK